MFLYFKGGGRFSGMMSGEGETRDDRLRMDDVVMRTYDRWGRCTSLLRCPGRAFMTRTLAAFELAPVSVTSFAPSGTTTLTARRAWREREAPTSEEWRMVCEGDVEVRDSAGHILEADKAVYHPRSTRLEIPRSGAGVRLSGPSCRISGRLLDSTLNTKRGKILDDVFLEAAQKGGGRFEAGAHMCLFDLERETYRLEGGVRAKDEYRRIRCDSLEYLHREGRIKAAGHVHMISETWIVSGVRADYSIRTGTGTVQGECMATRTYVETRKSGTLQEYTELKAEKVRLLSGGRMEAEGAVALKRILQRPGKPASLLTVHAARMYSDPREGKTNFDGEVLVENPQLKATGEHAIFYQGSGNFYVIGNARVEELGGGRVVNVVRGEKIIHQGETGRNVVLQGVEGEFSDFMESGE